MITPFSNDVSIYENISFLRKCELGLRWRHFFNRMILLKDNTFDVVKPQEEYAIKYGYHINNETCSKLLYFNSICNKHFLDVIDLEHTIGVMITRGKETKDNRFWPLDKVFSKICLDTFEDLFFDIQKCKFNYEDIRYLAQKHMGRLKMNLLDILKKVKTYGLSEAVRRKDIEEHMKKLSLLNS
jgi:hypothetical protein